MEPISYRAQSEMVAGIASAPVVRRCAKAKPQSRADLSDSPLQIHVYLNISNKLFLKSKVLQGSLMLLWFLS